LSTMLEKVLDEMDDCCWPLFFVAQGVFLDDSERRGVEDVDGAAGVDDADGAQVSATSERTQDYMVGLEQQHERSMHVSRISTML